MEKKQDLIKKNENLAKCLTEVTKQKIQLEKELKELPKKICEEIKNNIPVDKVGIAVKLYIETIINEIKVKYEIK